jgi:succinate dehydrogenase / fumarate reductase cytochrome b subunit
MTNPDRPLSPHLSIYRWPITMVLSILHRVTGISMAVGLVVFAAWLMYAASGPEKYQYFREVMSSPPGILLLVLWTLAFFIHLGNGIRHLVWDSGHGFEIPQANASAWIVLVFAGLATALLWVMQL